MPQIDQYIAQVQALSAEDKAYGQLADYVRKATSSILTSGLPQLDTVLQALELKLHSIGILGALYVKLNHETASDTLLALVQEFLLGFNVDEIRHISDIFCELCHKYCSILINKKEYNTIINVISQAIISLRSMPSQLLSIHADLFQACLLAKNFKPALRFLDVDITDIAKENNTFDSKYFLLYYYYGGMIYAALKDYNRALFCFEVAITTPANVVSQIVVEANKKYILISLIRHGKLMPLPKYISQTVARYLKPSCSAYVELSGAYTAKNADKFREVMTKHRELLLRDNNFGLAKQVLMSKNRRNIKKLTNTFLTLSLADVAHRCNLNGGASEAEKYLVAMIEDGEIYAAINKRDGMVFFRDNPEKFVSPDVISSINKDLDNAFDVYEKIDKLDSNYHLNPQYVQKLMKQSSASTWLNEDEGLGAGPGSSSAPDVYPTLGGF